METQFVQPITERYKNKYGVFQRPSMIYVWMQTAVMFAQRSTCIRNKVGCVILDAHMWHTFAIGYNGQPPGEKNECKSLDPGKCGCTHAEMNALRKLDQLKLDTTPAIMISTVEPCLNCATNILTYPVRSIIYLRPYRTHDGLNLLREQGVSVTYYNALVTLKDNITELFKI
jgi:dCMP deaminase